MISIWSQGAADENMPEDILVETLQAVNRHPWWLARSRLATALLRAGGVHPSATVLDVGCGWGVNLLALEAAGYSATGLDVSPKILKLLDRPDRRLIQADLNQPPPERCDSYSALLLLDVIEHLDDDRGTIRRLAPLAKANAMLIVSVPALPELFSDFDSVQGHRRRYQPETLRAVFDGAGFTVERILWWGQWMVPVLRRMRRNPAQSDSSSKPRTYADYLRLPPWPGAWLMKMFFAWEQRRALDGRLTTGTSLFAVTRRSIIDN